MDYSQDFDTAFKEWADSIHNNAELFLNGPEKSELINIYGQMIEFQKVLHLPLYKLNTSQFKFATGRELIIVKDIIFAFESLLEGLYLLSSNLYCSANHSTRCALEQTLSIIHCLLFYDLKYTTHATQRTEIMDIYVFRDYCKSEVKFEMGNANYPLEIFMERVYSNLSSFVHSRNIYNKTPNNFPVITKNLEFKNDLFLKTFQNISDTLDIMITLLFILVRTDIDEDTLSRLKEISSDIPNLKSVFSHQNLLM